MCYKVPQVFLIIKFGKTCNKNWYRAITIRLHKGRHLQQTCSARETGVMQELENLSLIRITNAPLILKKFLESFSC